MPTDSKSAKELKALRERVAGLSVRKLAKHLGIPASSYSYYEDGIKEQILPIPIVMKLDRALVGKGTPPITRQEVMALGGILDAAGPSPLDAPSPALQNERQTMVAPPDAVRNATTWPKDVPILGVTVGGLDGDFTLNKSDVNDYARRTPPLAQARKVFALYVQGSSMSKWREQGDLVYVDPIRPARIGDRVVVECHPEHDGDCHPAYLKELAGRSPSKLRLKQYNPETIIEIPANRVIAVHRVIEWAELLGV